MSNQNNDEKKSYRNVNVSSIALFSPSCKDDDEGPSNYSKFESTQTGLSQGILSFDENPGKSNANKDLYFHDITFITSALDAKGNGTGDYIDLTLASETKNLTIGVHKFVGTDTNSEPGDFAYGYLTKGFSANGGGDNYEFSSGTVTVAKSGSVYTIDFTGEVTDDKTR